MQDEPEEADHASVSSQMNKDAAAILEVLVGGLRHQPAPFTEEDLEPQLVIKIKVPEEEYVPRSEYLPLSKILTSPSYQLEHAYHEAESIIISQMEQCKQNEDPNQLKMRMTTSLRRRQMAIRTAGLCLRGTSPKSIQFECMHESVPRLGAFGLQLNTVIWVLQRECGFKVRAFLLYDDDLQQRYVYLFLRLSNRNLVKVARNYRIKKEIDYSLIDFYMNDPSGYDDRPIKLHSTFTSDLQHKVEHKRMGRYFKAKQDFADQTVLQEGLLDPVTSMRYQSFNKERQQLYERIRKEPYPITYQERMYLYNFNWQKTNPGCEKLFMRMQKQRLYYEQVRDIARKHQFTVYQERQVFEEFKLISKQSKGATFFSRLRAMLLYKRQIVAKDKTMKLFLPMEETKLCYILLKTHFQLNYLAAAGYDFFTLGNDFEKFGAEEGEVRGGLDGQCLADQWRVHSIGTDIKTVRNYVGSDTAFQILEKTYIIKYFLSVAPLFFLLFLIQAFFRDEIEVYTSIGSCIFYSISFSLLLLSWSHAQDKHIENYSDPISTRIFRSQHRGPYRRNLIDDEHSQFQDHFGIYPIIANLLCIIILAALLSAVGGIFHGFRLLLLDIFDPLEEYIYFDYVSLAHIIAYSLFFLIEDILRRFVSLRLIGLMVLIRDPPSDQGKRLLQDQLTFFYAIGIELIPPAFFLLIEPFSGVSCYSNTCRDELLFYIYSRSIIGFIRAVVGLTIVFIVNFFAQKIIALLRQPQVPSCYQEKLSSMLMQAEEESKKPKHDEEKMIDLLTLTNFSINFIVLPILPLFLLLTVLISHIGCRLQILYQERKPLPRSQKIIPFLPQLAFVYSLGVLVSSWVLFFTFDTVENRWKFLIDIFVTTISEDNIFTLRLMLAIIFGLIMLFIGLLTVAIASSVGSSAIARRQQNKFNQYEMSKGAMKVSLVEPDLVLPIQSIFRTFNPDRLIFEQINDDLYATDPFQKNLSDRRLV